MRNMAAKTDRYIQGCFREERADRRLTQRENKQQQNYHCCGKQARSFQSFEKGSETYWLLNIHSSEPNKINTRTKSKLEVNWMFLFMIPCKTVKPLNKEQHRSMDTNTAPNVGSMCSQSPAEVSFRLKCVFIWSPWMKVKPVTCQVTCGRSSGRAKDRADVNGGWKSWISAWRSGGGGV